MRGTQLPAPISKHYHHRLPTMAKLYVEPPTADSTAVFKADIFKGKVLFCTGGGSGICKAMTQAVVSLFLQVVRNTSPRIHIHSLLSR